MTKTLQDNREDNPYYEIIHNFFNRQVSLKGNHLLLKRSVKTDVSFLGSHMFAKHPRTREIVFFKDSFIVDENNKDENFSYLINYFTLSIIAQSFEAFESFIKDIYRRNLSLNIKNEAVLKIATKNVRSLKNAEVLKVLQTICPTLSEIFDDDNMSWLRKIELIRHCIVHNAQTVGSETIKDVKNRFIDSHFIFKPIPNSERSRIFVTPDATTIMLDAFQGLSFSTFILMSEAENFQVAMVESNEAKKKQ